MEPTRLLAASPISNIIDIPATDGAPIHLLDGVLVDLKYGEFNLKASPFVE